MIDLDALELEQNKEWTSEDELYCYFGAALCLNKLTYAKFRDLRGYWLVDRYIYPEARTLHIPLIELLVQMQAVTTNISWLFSLYLNISHVHAHYTEAEQIRMLDIIRKKNRLPA